MKKKRVLHILNELKASGAETMLYHAASYWADVGIECDILSTGENIGSYAQELKNAGYGVFHLHNNKRPDFFIKLRKLVCEGKYDVIHQHAEAGSYWTILSLSLLSLKIVRTIHSNFIFDGILRFKRKIQRQHLTLLGVQFVSISNSVAKNEFKRFGIETKLVYNWAALDYFNPPTEQERKNARATFGLNDSDIVMVSVGNCAYAKNHEAVLHALAKLSVNQLKYLHVGHEAEDGKEKLLAEKLGVNSKVIFAGKQDPLAALHAADFYVMPSRYEGFSIAALEALSTNLPSIFSDCPGLSDFDSFFPDLLYTDANAGNLHLVISKLIHDRDLYKLRAADYHTIAVEYFSIQKGVASYSALY
ncbi:glycosyltransferase [Iodobacter ciconiae]|uniref:Glycosyltransferase n=1 Tax=Iodobacter ciconiae TaxID=2496266 RepID=A0A3S8ZTU3_9NEIS|nr:glycosyltransferase [Iodobacter ciconiae]AZN36851.1 glycosyltransferase [Iodobacter ciconiae]